MASNKKENARKRKANFGVNRASQRQKTQQDLNNQQQGAFTATNKCPTSIDLAAIQELLLQINHFDKARTDELKAMCDRGELTPWQLEQKLEVISTNLEAIFHNFKSQLQWRQNQADTVQERDCPNDPEHGDSSTSKYDQFLWGSPGNIAASANPDGTNQTRSLLKPPGSH